MVWVFNEVDSVLNSCNERAVELFTAPLNAMLDQVREVSQGAHGDSFLWGILRVTVTFSHEGDNHLRVSFGTKGAGLKEWLFVPNTLLINVKSGFDIVDSINNKVETLPELIVENMFSCGIHIFSVGSNIKSWVHLLGDSASSL